MHILVILRLGRAKARDKLTPLLQTPIVEHITLVRHASVPIDEPKLTQIIHNVGLKDDGPPRSYWSSVRNLLACFRNGWHVTRHNKPDIIIAFNLFPYGVISWLIAHLNHLPIAISLIGTDFDRKLRLPILGNFLRFVLKTSNRVVIFGNEAREQLLSDGLKDDQVFVLPNTVDTRLFHPDPTVQPDFDLIYVGNLHAFKRVDLILQALSLVNQSRPETKLLVIGDGPERHNLENSAVQLGISHVVTFVGWSDDIPAYLRRSKILLLLSEHEGLPASILEALCTGLPVISTNVGAISSIIQDKENGILLPQSPFPLEVANSILYVLTDSDRYSEMSQQALFIRKTHGYDRASEIWNEILKFTN